jgi:ketosteroid isomerase-like protein
MAELAQVFMDRLQQLERDRDLDAFLSLFAPDAELSRAPRAASYRGLDGARAFWTEYLDAFAHIETKFERAVEAEGSVVLEWRSRATSKQGHPLEYAGCSVFEGGDGRVHRFRTYYDAASAGMGGAPSAARSSAAARSAE